MFPKWIKFILTYFSLWGFLPGRSTKLIQSRLLMTIISIFHIFLCIWCTLCSIQNFENHRKLIAFLDVINFTLYSGSCLILYWLILLDSFISRNDQHEFLQSLTQIHREFDPKLHIEKLGYFIAFFMLFIGDIYLFIYFSMFTRNVRQ